MKRESSRSVAGFTGKSARRCFFLKDWIDAEDRGRLRVNASLRSEMDECFPPMRAGAIPSVASLSREP